MRQPKRLHARECLLSAAASAALLLSCTGELGQPSAAPSISAGGPNAPGDQGSSQAPPACLSELPGQRFFLLDMQSYLNTVTDLLGPDTVSTADRQQFQRSDVFANGIPTLNDATPYERVAVAAAKTLTGPKLDAMVGCSGADQTDACARQALGAFMERAYRRPIDPVELEGLMALPYATGRVISFQRGIQLAVEAILQAGSTMYLKELGLPSGAGAWALDAYEVASQISFFLLDSIPDSELYQAARSGQLSTKEQVADQVQRLLAQPLAQARLTSLLMQQYHLDDIRTTTAVDGSFQALFTDSLRESFYQESSLLIDDVLWKNPRSALDLVLSRDTFMNQELADKVYHVPFTGTGSAFVKTPLGSFPAAGLLTHGSLLAGKAKANTGSVIKRGKSIRTNFLCLGSPPPPPVGNTELNAKLEEQAQSSRSEAELAAERAGQQPCGGCHASFDPLGMALNQFDRIGRFDASQVARADISGVDASFSGVVVDGPQALGQQLSSQPGFASCIASTVLRFATRQASASSACAATDATSKFSALDHRFDALVRAVATSEMFLVRREGDGQ